MSKHTIKCIFILLCAFTGLGELGIANSAIAAVPRELFLIANFMPTIGQETESSISFTATKPLTSVVRHVTFFVPEGVGIGSGRTGNMPVCKVADALPSNHPTRVSGPQGDGHFALAPMHSIPIRYAVDAAASPRALSGLSLPKRHSDGVRDMASVIDIQPGPGVDDDVHRQQQRQKREVGSFVAMGMLALSLSAQAFHGWSLPAIPLGQTPFAISVQGGNSP